MILKQISKALISILPFLSAVHAAGPKPITHAVLVHGIWQNDIRCFGFLRHDLEKRGVKVLIANLKPADGRDGLRPMAKQLDSQISEAFGTQQNFLLIGFSMGGLISRDYLQNLGGHDRCDAFVSISTPHHGTRMAKLHYGKGAAQMRPGSSFLKELAKGEDKLSHIPLVSYRTPLDAVIVPSESSKWDKAENIEVTCLLHPLMTASPTVRNDLLRRFSYPRVLANKRLPEGGK